MHKNQFEQTNRWEQMRVIIDDSMDELNDVDREVVLTHFFRNPSFEIGEKFLSQSTYGWRPAAHVIEKLRRILNERGISITALELTAILVNQAGLVPPPEIAPKIIARLFNIDASAHPQ